MTLKERAYKRAAELGCSWDIQCRIVVLDAPQGFVFCGTQTHSLACGDLDQLGNDVWRGALHDMDLGVERCENIDCEMCE